WPAPEEGFERAARASYARRVAGTRGRRGDAPDWDQWSSGPANGDWRRHDCWIDRPCDFGFGGLLRGDCCPQPRSGQAISRPLGRAWRPLTEGGKSQASGQTDRLGAPGAEAI